MTRMTPNWLLQLLWFAAGIGGTGALWYLLAQRKYYPAVWTGFVVAVVVCLTIALYIRNDLLKREQNRTRARPISVTANSLESCSSVVIQQSTGGTNSPAVVSCRDVKIDASDTKEADGRRAGK